MLTKTHASVSATTNAKRVIPVNEDRLETGRFVTWADPGGVPDPPEKEVELELAAVAVAAVAVGVSGGDTDTGGVEGALLVF